MTDDDKRTGTNPNGWIGLAVWLAAFPVAFVLVILGSLGFGPVSGLVFLVAVVVIVRNVRKL